MLISQKVCMLYTMFISYRVTYKYRVLYPKYHKYAYTSIINRHAKDVLGNLSRGAVLFLSKFKAMMCT